MHDSRKSSTSFSSSFVILSGPAVIVRLFKVQVPSVFTIKRSDIIISGFKRLSQRLVVSELPVFAYMLSNESIFLVKIKQAMLFFLHGSTNELHKLWAFLNFVISLLPLYPIQNACYLWKAWKYSLIVKVTNLNQ